MKRLKTAAALLVLTLSASSASFAQVTYIPPGGDHPRFGGEIPLTDVGPVAGYWTTQCRTWRLRSQARRNGPEVPPQMSETFKRFVAGLISKKPSYDDLDQGMADAVRKHINTYWPSFNRMGRATVASEFDKDQEGNRLFVINQTGGRTHWNMTVDPNGKIAAAFICAGDGL